MPSRDRLRTASVVAVLATVAGIVLAIVVGSAVASLYDSDDGFLAGLLEGLAAGLLVLILTPAAAATLMRAHIARTGDATPGWWRSLLAVVVGDAAAAVPIGLVAAAEMDRLGVVAAVLAPFAAGAATYGVLVAWAEPARSPSRG